jgi:hypothetical protein
MFLQVSAAEKQKCSVKQLIGWVCVSNKFLSTLANVPMLEWPGSDVDRAQRRMARVRRPQAAFFEAEGASLSSPSILGRPLTFDERSRFPGLRRPSR